MMLMLLVITLTSVRTILKFVHFVLSASEHSKTQCFCAQLFPAAQRHQRGAGLVGLRQCSLARHFGQAQVPPTWLMEPQV